MTNEKCDECGETNPNKLIKVCKKCDHADWEHIRFPDKLICSCGCVLLPIKSTENIEDMKEALK